MPAAVKALPPTCPIFLPTDSPIAPPLLPPGSATPLAPPPPSLVTSPVTFTDVVSVCSALSKPDKSLPGSDGADAFIVDFVVGIGTGDKAFTTRNSLPTQ